jgi:flagellar biosynthesis GTPase FlhF
LHLSPVLKKISGILCVVLLCVSSGVARTGKKSSHKSATATSSKTRSSHSASAARSKSKAHSDRDDSKRESGSERRASARSSRQRSGKAAKKSKSRAEEEETVATRKSRSRSKASDDDTQASSRSSESASKADRTPTRVAVSRPRGQHGIDGDRAREIQEALIREHYLDGEATGVWDSRTRDAMLRFQNANGWQTRIVPDSRALIMLGLGPKHADVLNPESVSDSIPRSAREMRPGGALPR